MRPFKTRLTKEPIKTVVAVWQLSYFWLNYNTLELENIDGTDRQTGTNFFTQLNPFCFLISTGAQSFVESKNDVDDRDTLLYIPGMMCFRELNKDKITYR